MNRGQGFTVTVRKGKGEAKYYLDEEVTVDENMGLTLHVQQLVKVLLNQFEIDELEVLDHQLKIRRRRLMNGLVEDGRERYDQSAEEVVGGVVSVLEGLGVVEREEVVDQGRGVIKGEVWVVEFLFEDFDVIHDNFVAVEPVSELEEIILQLQINERLVAVALLVLLEDLKQRVLVARRTLSIEPDQKALQLLHQSQKSSLLDPLIESQQNGIPKILVH